MAIKMYKNGQWVQVANSDSGSGGSSSQPDWEQNDSAASDYVKNRPFYKELADTVIFDGDVTTVLDEDFQLGIYEHSTVIVDDLSSLEAGQNFVVVLDDVTYNNAYNVIDGGGYIGNLILLIQAMYDLYNGMGYSVTMEQVVQMILGVEVEDASVYDTGEPFLIMPTDATEDDPDGSTLFVTEEVGTYHFTISGVVTTYHKLDSRYLPDDIAATSQVNADWSVTDETSMAYIKNKPKIQVDWSITDETADGYIKNKPDMSVNKDYIILIDEADETEYKVYLKDGDFIFDSIEDLLVDFTYTINDDGTYTLNEWKGTLNGVESTECVIPNLKVIL